MWPITVMRREAVSRQTVVACPYVSHEPLSASLARIISRSTVDNLGSTYVRAGLRPEELLSKRALLVACDG